MAPGKGEIYQGTLDTEGEGLSGKWDTSIICLVGGAGLGVLPTQVLGEPGKRVMTPRQIWVCAVEASPTLPGILGLVGQGGILLLHFRAPATLKN